MPADIDLRAEVLAGINWEIGVAKFSHASAELGTECRVAITALRHLREIVDMHKMVRETWEEEGGETGEEVFCGFCNCDYPCPTLVSLAKTYAPQALAKMEADR